MSVVLPSEFHDTELLTRPLADLVGLAPELGWKPIGGGGFRATNDAAAQARFGCRASRIEAKPRAGGPTYGITIHGSAECIRWIELVWGSAPKGADYRAAVIEMARVLGVDASILAPDGGGLSPEQIAQREADAKWRRAEQLVRAGEQAREAARERLQRIAEARRIWEAAAHVGGVLASDVSPAWLYLAGRLGVVGPRRSEHVGIECPPLPESIRSIPDKQSIEVEYNGKAWTLLGPALVASIVCHGEGITGVQVIPLARRGRDDYGKRGGVGADKPMYGATRGEGGCGHVWLPRLAEGVADGPTNVPNALVVCEGLETGYALLAVMGCAVACCLSAGGLDAVSLSVPPGAGPYTIYVAGDHDEPSGPRNERPGDEAARRCAARLAREHPGATVRLCLPTHDALRWTVEAPGREEVHHADAESTENGEVGRG